MRRCGLEIISEKFRTEEGRGDALVAKVAEASEEGGAGDGLTEALASAASFRGRCILNFKKKVRLILSKKAVTDNCWSAIY